MKRIQEVLTALMNPANGKPKTLLVVAHRLGTIAGADQIVVVHEGQVEAVGTHAELLANPSRYASMWEAFLAAEQGIAPNLSDGSSIGRTSRPMEKMTDSGRGVRWISGLQSDG